MHSRARLDRAVLQCYTSELMSPRKGEKGWASDAAPEAAITAEYTSLKLVQAKTLECLKAILTRSFFLSCSLAVVVTWEQRF